MGNRMIIEETRMSFDGRSAWPRKLAAVRCSNIGTLKRGCEVTKGLGAMRNCVLREIKQNVGVRGGQRSRLTRSAVTEFTARDFNDREARGAGAVRSPIGRR